MKGKITDWVDFLGAIELIASIQIGEDLFTDKDQIRERARKAYEKKEVIEVYY